MISIENICKSFGNKKALDDININVEKGEILAILGSDGSGKSTLIKIIIGMIKPDSGKISVNDIDITKDISSTRELLGYKAQEFSLYQDLTVSENIRFFGSLYTLSGKDLDERESFILDFIGLKDFKQRFAEALSGGMKSRLAIGCALVHNPLVLLLDEPNVGVDPASRKSVWKLLKELTKSGKTIVLTTPYFLEGDLADKVTFIKNGKIVLFGKPKDLVENLDFIPYTLTKDNLQEFYFDLKKKKLDFKFWLKNEHIRVLLSKDIEIDRLSEKISISRDLIKRDDPDLEDIYLWHSA